MNKSIKRIEELVEILNKARKSYEAENIEIMSNYEYDKLYDELLQLEKETNLIMDNSPTIKVGYEIISSLEKVSHDKPMLSLDKTKNIEQLISFLGNNKGILSWKLDGLTIVVKYKNGKLFNAITRGNGVIGEDITHNAKMFVNLPKKINYKGTLTIRGEAVIKYEDFLKINENMPLDKQYKNPRNLCSGTVRQLNSEVLVDRNVNFYCFSLIEYDNEENINFDDSKESKLKWLELQGFTIVERYLVDKENLEETLNHMKNKIETNEFGSDGLVLTFDSILYSENLGTTSKFPKDSIAFKWKDEIAETTLLNVDWNTSRTGLINPIAVFEPVDLEGTIVNKASLHNVSIVKTLKLGIGDKITVYKANMIIPQLAENITKSGNLPIPNKCKECGGEAIISNMNDVEVLRCINTSCIAQLVHGLAHFSSRNAMNIEGLSIATIEEFIKEKIITNYVDIYNLEQHKEKICNLKGFGEKSYNNIQNAVENSKNVKLYNFVYALGILNVGLANSKLMCKHFNYNLDDIINANVEELVEIEGFGEIIGKSVVDYFSIHENKELINKIRNILIFEKIEENNNSLPLNNLVFVVTGNIEQFKNRKELQEKIENLGGKVSTSVSKNTNYLINNDVNSSSSKNKKANELGVEIISEEMFIKKFIN